MRYVEQDPYLGITKVDQGVLVRSVCLLQVIHHEVAVTCAGVSHASVHNGWLFWGTVPRLPQASPLWLSILSTP